MINFIELLIALSLIVLILPQTPTENIVLRKILDNGLIGTYSEAKSFLTKITWLLIFLFLFLLFLMSIQF